MYEDSPQSSKNSACLEDVVRYYKSHTLFACVFISQKPV